MEPRCLPVQYTPPYPPCQLAGCSLIVREVVEIGFKEKLAQLHAAKYNILNVTMGCRPEEGNVRREYPEAPIVAVGAIILEGGRIVLVRRGNEPSLGLWTFPGGAVELGEPIREAVRREALEETGLVVDVGPVFTVIDNVVPGEQGRTRYHYVIIDFLARPVGGTLQAGSDVDGVCWASLADLEGLEMTEKAGQIARRLLADSRNPPQDPSAP
jgi:8-oxo-dGTP diphosphatase